MHIPLAQRLLTVDEYKKMAEAGILTEDERVELLDGKIIEMSPAGNRHAAMVKRLNALFNQLLGGNAIISIQDPLVVDPHSMPEPDVAILKFRADYYETGLPTSSDALLVIEVADSSLEKDQKVKSSIYSAAGIPEYWIINLEQNEVEVYREPFGREYLRKEVLHSGSRLSLSPWNLEVEVATFFFE